MSESYNWNCDRCGKHMNPHGDCLPCEKKQCVKDEAEGRIKRAKSITVGDVIFRRLTFKPETISVGTVKVTPKGKVVVNEGKGHSGGEYVFQPDQWVNVVVNDTFNVGDKVKIVSSSIWKGKEGTIHSKIEGNGCYRVAGLEMFHVAFAPQELVKLS